MSGKFSVVILTLNEARNLGACLESIRDCEDVLVLDSGSTDETLEIARKWGARTLVNKFDNFAQQRNFAHEAGQFKFPWVFHLDADEQFTPRLFDECSTWCPPQDVDGAWSAPKMIWQGHWVKHCTDFPAWQARWVRHDRFKFVQSGHGQREHPRMKMVKMDSFYLHDISAEGKDAWLKKHRTYAKQEAEAFLNSKAPSWGSLWSGKSLERRRALKYYSFFFPFRPTVRWIYQFFLRGGFLDGYPGFDYCRMLLKYESMTQCEIRRRKRSKDRG